MALAALALYRQSCSFQRSGNSRVLLFASCASVVRGFATKMNRPQVFFDISADGQALGRVVIEVSYFYSR